KDVGLKDKRICKTTVQGRYLLSDDWGILFAFTSHGLYCLLEYLLDGYTPLTLLTIVGHVCDALSVDPVSRCCSGKGAQFDCQ
ncbi:hypothetical protein C3L33_17572, partial [Rhododendron williamsianum]